MTEWFSAIRSGLQSPLAVDIMAVGIMVELYGMAVSEARKYTL